MTTPTAIPTQPNDAAVPQAPASAVRDGSQRLPGNIMIIDDEPANVAVVRRLLERAGYHSFKSTSDSSVAFSLNQLILWSGMVGLGGALITARARLCQRA